MVNNPHQVIGFTDDCIKIEAFTTPDFNENQIIPAIGGSASFIKGKNLADAKLNYFSAWSAFNIERCK